jgi:predicted ATPase
MLFSRLRVQNFQSISDSGDLDLGPITLLVGRNNTGKSALLRAVYMLQEGAPYRSEDIRLGADETKMKLSFDRFPPNALPGFGETVPATADYYPRGGLLELTANRRNELSISLISTDSSETKKIHRWSSKEPFNLIYPSLARRHQQYYQEQPTLESASTVHAQDSNLVARVAALSTAQIPEAEKFRNLCQNVLGFTVDVLLGQAQNQSQKLGIQVTRFTSVPLESMGAGVSSVLSLLVSLCDAKDKLFLIEEPENDLHPQALKSLLDAIVTASNSNQFLITTHNSVVLTRLGSAETTIVLQTTSDNLRLPTSTYSLVSSPDERLDILRRLGYELADFYLGAGWLIFEESSAERIIREWFIPWFAPALGNLHTVAAKGASRVTALAQALGEMLIFAHLEPVYMYRAWILVDGDDAGKQVVERLRATFDGWPPENFSHWDEPEFESYYPDQFKERVAEIRSTADKRQRQEMKKALLHDVLGWISEDPEAARSEFEKSAADVISHLTRIAAQINIRAVLPGAVLFCDVGNVGHGFTPLPCTELAGHLADRDTEARLALLLSIPSRSLNTRTVDLRAPGRLQLHAEVEYRLSVRQRARGEPAAPGTMEHPAQLTREMLGLA